MGLQDEVGRQGEHFLRPRLWRLVEAVVGGCILVLIVGSIFYFWVWKEMLNVKTPLLLIRTRMHVPRARLN